MSKASTSAPFSPSEFKSTSYHSAETHREPIYLHDDNWNLSTILSKLRKINLPSTVTFRTSIHLHGFQRSPCYRSQAGYRHYHWLRLEKMALIHRHPVSLPSQVPLPMKANRDPRPRGLADVWVRSMASAWGRVQGCPRYAHRPLNLSVGYRSTMEKWWKMICGKVMESLKQSSWFFKRKKTMSLDLDHMTTKYAPRFRMVSRTGCCILRYIADSLYPSIEQWDIRSVLAIQKMCSCRFFTVSP